MRTRALAGGEQKPEMSVMIAMGSMAMNSRALGELPTSNRVGASIRRGRAQLCTFYRWARELRYGVNENPAIVQCSI